MNLVAVSSNIQDNLTADLKDTHILKVDCSQSKTFFEDIARCGIAIEKHFLSEDGKSMFWTDKPKYKTASIIWDRDFFVNFAPCLEQWQDARGDEIIFNSLDVYKKRAWAMGNPRAVVKWASCALNVENINFAVFPQSGTDPHLNKFPTSRLVWIAYRIGLRVYGYSE